MNGPHVYIRRRAPGSHIPAHAPLLRRGVGPLPALAHSHMSRARSQLRVRKPSRSVVCSSDSGKADQIAEGKKEGGAAIELAEEGPSTDLSVIWGRLLKA